MASSTTTLSNLMSTYYDKRFLERAKLLTRYDFLATMKTIPRNSGKTIIFNRITPLAVATTPLTECVSPTPVNLTSTQVTATLAQYGNTVTVCELFELTSIDENLKEHIDTLATNGAETLDTLMMNELAANSTIQYAAGRSTLATVVTGDVLTGQEIRRSVRTLKKNKAMVFADGYFRGVVPVSAEYDLRGNSEWLDAYRYTDASNIRNGEIGTLHGVKFVDTNNEFSQSNGAGSPITVYSTFIAGMDGFAAVNLAGQEGARVIVKNPGPNDTSNPLNLYSTVSWKATFACKVLNSAWVVQIISAVGL